ncbi:hypothetical protein ACJ72_08024 [Emergomyces africanus]|uniref:Helicase C-terminal domain-containing protein n=1 Tax=Emergomyces africanus TaxID=1955775 RepID=A0A1B7NLI7_9EURO|nr:hypothetical protein ACJ72_08024 [Emergomyces africanus]
MCCQSVGLQFREFSDNLIGEYSLIFVTSETAVKNKQWCESLVRIKWLGELQVQHVLLSGTLPKSLQQGTLLTLGISNENHNNNNNDDNNNDDDGNGNGNGNGNGKNKGKTHQKIEVICGSSVLTHIKYFIYNVKTQQDVIKCLLGLVGEVPDGIIIIFTLSLAETDCLAAKFNWLKYHSKLNSADKKHVLQQLQQGHSCVIVAITSLGNGIDACNVVLIVHWCSSFSILDLAQQAARAGCHNEENS